MRFAPIFLAVSLALAGSGKCHYRLGGIGEETERSKVREGTWKGTAIWKRHKTHASSVAVLVFVMPRYAVPFFDWLPPLFFTLRPRRWDLHDLLGLSAWSGNRRGELDAWPGREEDASETSTSTSVGFDVCERFLCSPPASISRGPQGVAF